VAKTHKMPCLDMSFSTKEPLIIFRTRALLLVALLQKMTCNLSHAMSLGHPVERARRVNRDIETYSDSKSKTRMHIASHASHVERDAYAH